jgi:3-oxoacyl-[acyl-carrier protein] reductase
MTGRSDGELRIAVSGGSRSLGLAFCRTYLERGHRVFSFARSTTPDVHALAGAWGERFTFAEIDVADHEGPGRAAEEARAALGVIDVLINNASVGQDSLLAHTSDEEIERILAVDLTATIRLTRHVVRQMLLEGGGTIVNISSICATRGFAGLSVYAAAKGGLEAFTRSIARELGPRRIFVNCVAPGFFESEMSAALSPTQLDTLRRRTPSGNLTTVEQVVAATDLLVAADELNINGQVIAVDGGLSV